MITWHNDPSTLFFDKSEKPQLFHSGLWGNRAKKLRVTMTTVFFDQRGNVPKRSPGKNQKTILILCVLSLVFFALVKILPLKKSGALKEDMIAASKVMATAMQILREGKEGRESFVDDNTDVNHTGLIGLEFSSITTSIGSLEAKRTSTNPNLAGLVVFLLRKAGVRDKDTVAVGASGSFPALIVAALSAAKVMEVQPLLICSLGASQWGANDPEYHWSHMLNCLRDKELFDIQPIAYSLGGDSDIGGNMDADGRALLLKIIKESEIPFLYEQDLQQNVEKRMRLYEAGAGKNGIKAFINIGGSLPNIGTHSSVLDLKPGLIKLRRLPTADSRGILHEMAARKIPVIHLLFMKGLVQRYGLPWDPVSLPHPGEGKLYQFLEYKQPFFLVTAGACFLSIILVLFLSKCRKSRAENAS